MLDVWGTMIMENVGHGYHQGYKCCNCEGAHNAAYSECEVIIFLSAIVRNVGITLDSALTLDAYISKLSKAAVSSLVV